MRFRYFSYLLILGSASAYSQNIPEEFDYGRLEGSKYVNSFFDFSFMIPEDWFIQTKEEMEQLQKEGGELISGDDQQLKQVLKASEINVANLFAAFKYERGAPVDYNPSMMITAENVQQAPGIKTGSDYLFQSRRILMQGQFKYDHVDEEFEAEEINGITFHRMNANVNYLGIDIKQIYYATIRNRFSLIIILSFTNDDQKEELIQTLKTFQFGK